MLPVCDLDSLVAQLNSMPEKGNLTRPLEINELDWQAYGIAAGLSTRDLNYLKKQARELAPRSMRQAIYMYYELIRSVHPDEAVKWSKLSCLFHKTQQETRSMVPSCHGLRSTSVQAVVSSFQIPNHRNSSSG